MKKIILSICILFTISFPVFAANTGISKSKEITVKTSVGSDGYPRALITVKDKKVIIEIKNLDLNPAEANKLREEIEKKIELKDIPREFNLNMNLKISKKMLKEAGILRKELERAFDSEKPLDDFSLDFSSEDDKASVRIFKDLTVKKGEVYSDVVVVKGNLDFSGEAENVVVLLGNANIREGAKINRDLVVLFGSTVISDGAYVEGKQVTIEGSNFINNFVKFVLLPGAVFSAIAIAPLIILGKIFMWLVIFGFALLMFNIFPQTKTRTEDYMKENLLTSLGCGVLGILMLVPLFLFLGLSVIGIPLIPIVAAIVVAMAFGGYALAALYLGKLLPFGFTRRSEVWALLMGMIIILAVSFVPVIGQIAKWLAVTTGFGAICFVLIQVMFRRKKTVVTNAPEKVEPPEEL